MTDTLNTTLTETLLQAKKDRGLSFPDLESLLGLDEVCIAAIFYRQATATPEEAAKLSAALGLGAEFAEALTVFPTKGLGPVVPTDPFVYRLYEIMQVFGMPVKAVVQEKFGDGIMSAITIYFKSSVCYFTCHPPTMKA